MAASELSVEDTISRKQDWSIISLIGVVHASSHFFQLLLPTLYVFLAREFGFDYVELGALATTFFLVSCLGQASSGFVVDRIGPIPVLLFGLGGFVVSGIIIGFATSYWMLWIAAAIGGAGNSIFHPVDYSIINHRVSARRLGHAFSVHGLTGNLGWALTPLFVSAIASDHGWRAAAFSAAGLVAIVWCAAFWVDTCWQGSTPKRWRKPQKKLPRNPWHVKVRGKH